jgi:hypothetical protein
MSFLILFFLTIPTTQADPIEINEHASRKIFYALTRAGAHVTTLNHHHDREYALQESIHVYRVSCEISLSPMCFLSVSEDLHPGNERRLTGQDAWDIGFTLSEAGVTRTKITTEKYTVRAEKLSCILKGSGKTATCRIQE